MDRAILAWSRIFGHSGGVGRLVSLGLGLGLGLGCVGLSLDTLFTFLAIYMIF